MAQEADVKINGDATDAVKALEDVGAAAEATQEKLDGVGRKGAEAGAKATNPWKDGLGLFKDLLPRNLQVLQRRFESTSRQVGRMGGSFKILGQAIKAVPIFLIVEGFRWIIDNWEKISDFFTGTTAGMKAMKEAAKAGSEAMIEFNSRNQSLATIIQDGNASLQDREYALKELKKVMPEIEGMTLAQATAEGVLAEAMAKRAQLESDLAERAALQQAYADAIAKRMEAEGNLELQLGDVLTLGIQAISQQITYNGALEDEARIKARLDELNGIIIGQESELAAQQQDRADALKAEQEAQRKAEEAKRKAAQDAKSRAELNRKLDREIALAKIADDRERAKKELEFARIDEEEKAKTINASEATINKIREKYALELREMQAGWRAEDEAELQKETEARNAFWEDYWRRENDMLMSERQLAEQRLMEELADEKARVDALGYSKQAADQAKLEIEEQFQIRLAQLRDKYAEEDIKAEAEATAKYNETFLADKEKKLLEVQKEYDELKAIAAEYGLDTVKLEEWRTARIKEIEQKALEETKSNADARFQAISGFADEIGGILSELGDMAEEGSKRQRRLAIAEVLLSQAQAMASAVRGAAEAAASTGPGAPFVLAGYIASMLGTILGTFASIKKIVGASGEESNVTTQTRPIQQAMIPNVAPQGNPQFNIGPVQAYVVESQMQAQLNMTAGVARRARL